MASWSDKIISATKATTPGSFATLDLRTQEGRYARDICDGIAADLGGAPNAAQQILCQMFALKVLRVQLLVKTILSGETVNQHTENYCLAWMNSARRDLEALGVLDMPSGNDGLFSIHPAEMTDEQLDAALAAFGCQPDLKAPASDYDEDAGL